MEQSITKTKTKNKNGWIFTVTVLTILAAIMVTVYYIGRGENPPLY